ncbi:MAG TPA: DDE-type integrase/transposase/recombinase [Bryobacteraceae bacterium]|nr:DDE-type integrase/transposase/recombinase [Bryobacteraceae bacterium]
MTNWFMDETYVHVAGRWMYLFWAVDNHAQTVDFYLSARDRETGKQFLQAALAIRTTDRGTDSIDRSRSYSAAIRELKAEGKIRPTCRYQCRQHGNNRIESDHRLVKRRLRATPGPRKKQTAWAVIQGIEVVQMITIRTVLCITRQNRHGQACVCGSVLGLV